MPWKCPACQTQITHDGELPQPKRVYRCHVCRLELVLDEGMQKLTVAPLSMLPPTHANRRATDSKD
jgi:DNA-directed RNA polymerase subunit RPC12/RpoP